MYIVSEMIGYGGRGGDSYVRGGMGKGVVLQAFHTDFVLSLLDKWGCM